MIISHLIPLPFEFDATWIAIQPFSIGTTDLEIGDELVGFDDYMYSYWHQGNYIGMAHDPWTKDMIKRYKETFGIVDDEEDTDESDSETDVDNDSEEEQKPTEEAGDRRR